MEDKVKYADVIDRLKGSSPTQFINMLWVLALAGYADKDLLNEFNSKLGTDKKLAFFTELGYLNSYSSGFFTITDKSLNFLKEEGRLTGIVRPKLTGSYSPHQQKLSAVILKEYKEYQDAKEDKDLYVIYPTFKKNNAPWFDPDACLIYKDKRKAKIVFLEVEIEKPDWQNYIDDKMKKYEEQGRNGQMYSVWWKHWHEKLNLNLCEPEEFCFSVRVERN